MITIFKTAKDWRCRLPQISNSDWIDIVNPSPLGIEETLVAKILQFDAKLRLRRSP